MANGKTIVPDIDAQCKAAQRAIDMAIQATYRDASEVALGYLDVFTDQSARVLITGIASAILRRSQVWSAVTEAGGQLR